MKTRNRLAWIISKVIVFTWMAISVPQGTLWIFQDMRDAGVDLNEALAVSAFIVAMSGGGAALIWNLLIRNDPYRSAPK